MKIAIWQGVDNNLKATEAFENRIEADPKGGIASTIRAGDQTIICRMSAQEARDMAARLLALAEKAEVQAEEGQTIEAAHSFNLTKKLERAGCTYQGGNKYLSKDGKPFVREFVGGVWTATIPA